METLAAFDRRFPTEASCRDFLVARRWPDGVRCPRCNRKEKVYPISGKPYSWRCRNADCGGRNGYNFSVTTHTIFEDTKVALIVWFKIAYLILTAKKGMSALQVHRVMFGKDSGHDYRTTWYICQRWRCAMKGDVMPLDGKVEVDETFIGGKEKNKQPANASMLALAEQGKSR